MQFTLASINGKPWPPGKRLEAVCNKTNTIPALTGKHVAPHPDCTCGIYSRYDPNDMDDIIGGWPGMTNVYVYGSVILSGMIDHGERGSQAQYAQIESLCHASTTNPLYKGHPFGPTRARDIVKIIAARYGVPLFNTMDELAFEFPPENLDFLEEMKKSQDEDDKNTARIKTMAAAMDITSEEVEAIIDRTLHASSPSGRISIWGPPTISGGKPMHMGYVNGSGIAWTPTFPTNTTSVTYSAADQAYIMRQLYGNNT